MRTKPLKIKLLLFSSSLCLCCFMSYSQNTYPWPSSGPIGIGVTSPNGNLHIRNSTDGSDEWSGIRFYPATSSTSGQTSYHRLWGFRKSGLWIGGSANGSTYLKSNILLKEGGIFFGFSNGTTNPESAANTHFTVLNGGNVGIGTTSPAAKLDIKVNDNLVSSTAIGISYNTDNDIFSIWNNGSIAINRQNPRANLSVNGGNMQYTGVIEYRPRDFNDIGLLIEQDRCGGSVIDSKAFVISYCGSTNENFVVYGNGKTFIDNKLTAKEIEVKADVWSDFVFDKDYKLTPIGEVEEFIHMNKHLPGVPSESEVKKNGLNLGEMDAVLLQKIEEMTLYIIELKKENEVQKDEINTLKTLIK